MVYYGSADADLSVRVKEDFERKCIFLLEWACRTLNNEKTIDTEWGEENITANIYTYIDKSQLAVDYDIHIRCEQPLFSQDILDNRKKAKGAFRIDLMFQHNWDKQKYCFYVEAKNLVEHDFTKKGNKTATKAIQSQNRYISTGIDHFLGSHYPKGCLLGYVLNGSASGVQAGLNAILTQDNRGDEILVYASGISPWICYKSDHVACPMNLTHFWFEF